MPRSLEELEEDIEAIKKRNRTVEIDKAWENSWVRKSLVLSLTYVVIVIFFYITDSAKPWLYALVPVLGFWLSTLSVSAVKKFWVQKNNPGSKTQGY